MSRYAWVVIDAVKQEMRCNHCGEAEPLSLVNGKRLDFAAGIMKTFVSAHKGCKATPEIEVGKSDV